MKANIGCNETKDPRPLWVETSAQFSGFHRERNMLYTVWIIHRWNYKYRLVIYVINIWNVIKNSRLCNVLAYIFNIIHGFQLGCAYATHWIISPVAWARCIRCACTDLCLLPFTLNIKLLNICYIYVICIIYIYIYTFNFLKMFFFVSELSTLIVYWNHSINYYVKPPFLFFIVHFIREDSFFCEGKSYLRTSPLSW